MAAPHLLSSYPHPSLTRFFLSQAERRHKEAQAEYESVSRLVKNEFVRFETERVEDFKNALEAFLEGMISRQKVVSSRAVVAFLSALFPLPSRFLRPVSRLVLRLPSPSLR